MCRAHGRPGTFLPHMWVNAQAVPRFYPNAVTLRHDAAAIDEQRATVDILARSNPPGRWAVKDSFATLDLSRRGFDLLFDARWIRQLPLLIARTSSDLAWQRVVTSDTFPAALFGDENFAMFAGSRAGEVVAGGTVYRAEKVVGLSNVVAEPGDAVTVFRDLVALAAGLFPGLPIVGYESGNELKAAINAGFEPGDELRIWVRERP
ncbi:MAG: hypothetical protein AB7F22_34355 [Reyranella sp.]|uniref:hypothetical protein n=1 Tax=Reyranella sp. TaxID=1929291 RepID=UPI003D0D6BC0